MVDQKKVVVHGSYFADNYGDTLLVKIMCDKVAALVGRSNVYLAVEGHREEQERIGYPVAPRAIRNGVGCVVYGGGGYFGERGHGFVDNIKWAARNYMRHLAWLSRYGSARVAVFGAGFGPISNRMFRSRVCALIDRADAVLVRDDESLRFMQEYGVSHPNSGTCVDLALSLPPVVSDRKGVAVHAESLSQAELKIVFDGIVGVLGQESVDVIFDNAGGDTPTNREKYQRAAAAAGLSEVRFHPYVGVEETLRQVTLYAVVITAKLHVGITTIAQGGCVISIPSHQKTIRLFRQLGVERYCIQRDQLSPERLALELARVAEFSPDRGVINAGLARVDAALARFLG